MGSLDSSSIDIVAKQNLTFRNRGGRQIVKSDSRADVETTIVSSPPVRVEGSGSIVRNDNSVDHYAEVVTGTYMGGRSSSARVASKYGQTRDLDVELGDNKTMGVIPDGLAGTIPQLGAKHAGAKILIDNSTNDDAGVSSRVSDSGAYSPR